MDRLRQLKDKLIARLMTKFPGLLQSWANKKQFITHLDSPWTELKKPLNECKLALITTGGVHLKSQKPFNMLDPDGDPSYREFSSDTSKNDLMITHNYYDHRDADKDINIVIPVERLKDLKNTGEIKKINHRHFSFMGHIAGSHVNTLTNKTSKEVAKALKDDGVDIVILTPT